MGADRDTAAFADTEAMRRTARHLAWVGIEVGRPGRRFAFDRADISARSGDGGVIDLDMHMKQIEDGTAQIIETYKNFEKTAKIAAIITDLVVGFVVAAIVFFCGDHQFTITLSLLVIIQIGLIIYAFYGFWRFIDAVAEVSADSLRAAYPSKTVKTWTYKRKKISLFLTFILLSYPVRIFEFFLFVCGFLVLFTINADVATLTPMLRLAHWGFNLIAGIFYGNDNLTPQQRMCAAGLNSLATTFGGVVLEFIFPKKLKADSDAVSKLVGWSWPVVATLFAAVGAWLNAQTQPPVSAPPPAPLPTAQPARHPQSHAFSGVRSAPQGADASTASSSSAAPFFDTSAGSSSPAPMDAPPAPRHIEGRWTYPDSDRMSGLYPPRALEDEVEGTVTIDCAVDASGRVTGCDILSESPAGYGFGLATVKAFIRYAHVDPNSVDGGVIDGDRKTFTYKWTLDGSASS